jgi:ABC-type glycerol-3-phosphate transport system permease component
MMGSRGAWIPHAILMTGLALVLFPIYVAFVASSLTSRDILDAPMTLFPGPTFSRITKPLSRLGR